jgi:hypothetical protein
MSTALQITKSLPKFSLRIFLETSILGYSLFRNTYHMSRLPEKDIYDNHILLTDKIFMFPIATIITVLTSPYKILNDLRRMEYSYRNIDIPTHLQISTTMDVIFT